MLRSSRLLPCLFLLTWIAALPAHADAADDALRQALAPSEEVISVGNRAPLIRYNRYLKGGAHTHGSWNGGWQITHALAVWAGDTTADQKMLQQIAYSLEGGNCISANGGYPAQHEQLITNACAILRHAPRFWDQMLNDEQRRKIDLIMKASLIASAYTTADATYAGGRKPTAIDGDKNLGRDWNPNFQEGMIGGLLTATVYFGGVDAVYGILDQYNHAAFVAELQQAGLTNIHETFSWSQSHPDAGAPTGQQIEANIRNYRFKGERLADPMSLYHRLTMNTYGKRVSCGLNGGRGIVVNSVAVGAIVEGCDGLPNKGQLGMLSEFDSIDGAGPRSSVTYAYSGFRPNLAHHVLLLVSGQWRPGKEADEIVRRLDVGITDLIYKLGHGYRNYHNGKGNASAFGMAEKDWSWSFQALLPLWEQTLRPHHLGRAAARGAG